MQSPLGVVYRRPIVAVIQERQACARHRGKEQRACRMISRCDSFRSANARVQVRHCFHMVWRVTWGGARTVRELLIGVPQRGVEIALSVAPCVENVHVAHKQVSQNAAANNDRTMSKPAAIDPLRSSLPFI